jgi:hypothetical protein
MTAAESAGPIIDKLFERRSRHKSTGAFADGMYSPASFVPLVSKFPPQNNDSLNCPTRIVDDFCATIIPCLFRFLLILSYMGGVKVTGLLIFLYISKVQSWWHRSA